jgi:heme-degrading monooxygenase HmoA
MIKRIVKLTFQPEKLPDFFGIYDESHELIRAFPGCQHLELFQVIDQPNICFTYSFWDSPEALEAYRHSDLFKATWARTKVLFSDRPEAWSVVVRE